MWCSSDTHIYSFVSVAFEKYTNDKRKKSQTHMAIRFSDSLSLALVVHRNSELLHVCHVSYSQRNTVLLCLKKWTSCHLPNNYFFLYIFVIRSLCSANQERLISFLGSIKAEIKTVRQKYSWKYFIWQSAEEEKKLHLNHLHIFILDLHTSIYYTLMDDKIWDGCL